MKRCIAVVAMVLIALTAVTAAYAVTPVVPYDNPECLECHQVTQSAPINRVDFDVPGSVNYQSCAVCHSRVFQVTDHAHFGSPKCVACHTAGFPEGDMLNAPAGAPFAPPKVNTAYGFFNTASSVATSPASLHRLHSGRGWVETMNGTLQPQCSTCHAAVTCRACHANAVSHGSHSSSAYAAPVVEQADGNLSVTTALSCVNAACHSLVSAGTPAFATPECAACHPANTQDHGYSAAQHTASVGSTAETGGKLCSDCHSTELFAEHQRASSSSKTAGCTACHPSPRNTVGTWSKTCTEGACHASGGTSPKHGSIAAGHALPTSGPAAQCVTCHAGVDLAALHSSAVSSSDSSKTSCLVCHSASTVPSTNDCTECHFSFGSHPQSDHTATSNAACAGAGCHDINDASTNHSSCATCHANPSRVPVLPATASCSNCHAVESQPHYGAHWANPALLDGTGAHYAYGTGSAAGGAFTDQCLGCHTSNLMDEHLGEIENGITKRRPRLDGQGNALTCAACHSSLNPLVSDAIATGATNCDACHVVHRQLSVTHASTYADDKPVPCSPCHTSQIDVLHDGGYTTTTPSGRVLNDCDVCHSNFESPRGPVVQSAIDSGSTKCAACHAATHVDRGGHTASAEESLACGECHGSGQTTIDVRSVHPSCATCHENPGRVTDITTRTAECASCHAGAGIHPNMDHTAHASNECVSCHESADLFAIHSTDGQPDCALCHANPSRIPTLPTTADCVNCHGAKSPADPNHYDGPTHTATGGLYAGIGCSTCHKLGMQPEHAKASSGSVSCVQCHETKVDNLTAPWNKSCAACHAVHPNITAKHVSTSAECGGAGCHGIGDVAALHANAYFSVGDTMYSGCRVCHRDDTTVPTSTTCTTCHAGHGDLTAAHNAPSSSACTACHETADVRTVHAASTLGACDVCHDNPSRVPTLPATTACVNCHAADSPVDPNHYPAGSHVAADSTYGGYACSVCHKLGMKPEHAKASSGSVSCVQCHETKVDGLTAPWDRSCAACHASLHSSVATSHASTTGSCAGTGCHAIADVGALHSAASTTVAGVTYSGCRVCHRDDTTVPTSTTCTTCHAGHGDLTAAHNAPSSSACTACHETADVRTVHAASTLGACDVCHDNPSRVPTLPATTACVNCHAADSPVDPNHYPAGSHVAADSTENGYACSACHSLDMKPEHAKATSGSVTCVQCHETKVDGLVGSWNKTCAACHASRHAGKAAAHTSTKTSCSGTGCHAIGDVSVLHANTTLKCATCHGSGVTATADCSSAACHPTLTGDHEPQHDTMGVVDSGCYGCHFQSLTKEHAALGYACLTCHASTNAAVVSAIASGDRSCEGCHPAVNGRAYHTAQDTTEFISGNSSGHRVTSSLPGMRSSFKVGTSTYTWTLPSATSFLKTGWTTSSVVTCKDCHTYTGTAGPHGATAKVNIDPAYPGDYHTAYLSGSSASPSNLICNKCHTNFGNMNDVHGESDHSGSSDGKCVLCHTKIPHGWRLPRLLAYTNDPAKYSSTGLTGISLSSHSPSNWSENNCATSCGEHSSSMSNRWPSAVVQVGTLTGTVKDTTGAIISGATVVTDKGDTATTDAAGGYTFAGVATGAYTVTVSKTGLATQSKSATVTNNVTTTLDFSMAIIKPGTLSGTVTNSTSGLGLTGVTVQVTGDGSTTSASTGSYSLSLMPGTYTITYSLAGYTSQTKSVTITSNATTTQNVALVKVPVNLAAGKAATASSTYSSSYAASKAVDGSTSTYWRSTSTSNQWLMVDLGSSQSVKRFVVDWYSSNSARSYRIETSTDGTTWTSRYSTTSGSGDYTATLATPVTARYVRLYCTSGNSYSSYQVTEFETWDN